MTGLGTGAVPGASAAAGSVVLTASSLTPVVTIDLDASLQTEVAVGNKVSVTLPDGSATPGVISQISTVATSLVLLVVICRPVGLGNGQLG